jgi:hypothetical protein
MHPFVLTSSSPATNNTIQNVTPQCQTGSLQVALSKTLRRSDFASCPKCIAPERFRYSPRTFRSRRLIRVQEYRQDATERIQSELR